MKRRCLVSLLLVGAVVMLGGCYEHVVSSDSSVRNTQDVYQPNAPAGPGPVEQILWGEEGLR